MQFQIRKVLSLFEMICCHRFSLQVVKCLKKTKEWLKGPLQTDNRTCYRNITERYNENIFPGQNGGQYENSEKVSHSNFPKKKLNEL